jgi:hypothetical protein
MQKLTDDYGLGSDLLQRIGTLFVCCGMFEFHVEKAFWAISGENPIGNFPSTDRTQIGGLIAEIGKLADAETGSLAEAIRLVSEVATPLLEYRNAIAHGLLVRFNFEHASFVNNGTWHGEKRKRQPTIVHVDIDRLDASVDVADTLSTVAMIIFYGCSGPAARHEGALDEWVNPLLRAKELATKLRL